MNRFVLILLVAGLPVAASAADVTPTAKGGQTYARHLAEVARKHHPEVAAITIRTEATKDLAAGVAGSSPAKAPKGAAEQIALHDVSGDPVGTIEVVFAKPGDHKAALADIQSYVGHHAISAKNFYDPYPYDPAFKSDTRAQQLVDLTMKAHPELIVFAIHATPPHKKTNVIIGSNIGRIGKQADEDDLRVIEKGSTNLEVAENGKRFEVELPLNDAKGHRIGALGTVFSYHDGDDKQALHDKAIKIRDALARQIPTSASLFQPRR